MKMFDLSANLRRRRTKRNHPDRAPTTKGAGAARSEERSPRISNKAAENLVANGPGRIVFASLADLLYEETDRSVEVKLSDTETLHIRLHVTEE